jgi:hypothetical protein
LPTIAQCVSCTELCQELTGFYVSINLIRIDERTQNLVVLAGEEVAIEIQPDGNWEFSE